MALISPTGVFLGKVSTAILLAGVVTLCGTTADAQAQAQTSAAKQPASPVYMSLTGRPAASESRPLQGPESEPGFYLGGVVGYAITGSLRAEIEAFYRQDAIDAPPAGTRALDMTFTPSRPAPGGASVYGGMARGLWEPGNSAGFTPYIGGGIGLATAEFDIIVDSVREREEESLFAYEFTAGARYTITPGSSIRAGYRLFGTRDSEHDPAKPNDLVHAIELGIKYRF